MFVCKGNNGTIMQKQPSLEPLASVPDNFQSQGVLGGGGVGRYVSLQMFLILLYHSFCRLRKVAFSCFLPELQSCDYQKPDMVTPSVPSFHINILRIEVGLLESSLNSRSHIS